MGLRVGLFFQSHQLSIRLPQLSHLVDAPLDSKAAYGGHLNGPVEPTSAVAKPDVKVAVAPGELGG